MRINTPRGALAATVIALALVVSACGSEGGSDDASADAPRTTTTAASSDVTTPGNPDTSLPTGEEICTKVPADTVSSALGLEITKASPSDPSADLAPTCTYAYTGAKGKAGAITVSALRPLDMAGRTGAEGYKLYLQVNKDFSKGVEFDEVAVDVGRESVRFTGPNAHVAISDTGTQVVLVSVPKGDADGEQAEALLVAVVGAIG